MLISRAHAAHVQVMCASLLMWWYLQDQHDVAAHIHQQLVCTAAWEPLVKAAKATDLDSSVAIQLQPVLSEEHLQPGGAQHPADW
jgi:hypothetical protein